MVKDTYRELYEKGVGIAGLLEYPDPEKYQYTSFVGEFKGQNKTYPIYTFKYYKPALKDDWLNFVLVVLKRMLVKKRSKSFKEYENSVRDDLVNDTSLVGNWGYFIIGNDIYIAGQFLEKEHHWNWGEAIGK